MMSGSLSAASRRAVMGLGVAAVLGVATLDDREERLLELTRDRAGLALADWKVNHQGTKTPRAIHGLEAK